MSSYYFLHTVDNTDSTEDIYCRGSNRSKLKVRIFDIFILGMGKYSDIYRVNHFRDFYS